MRTQQRRALLAAAAMVALTAAAWTPLARAVTFTTSYVDGANWNALYAQGFSPSQTPNPDPALPTDALVPLDRFQFFKSGNAANPINVRLAIVSNYFLNLATFTTSSAELVGLSVNKIRDVAAIPTGGSITFHFDDLPLVYGNDYAAIFVQEGAAGALSPVLVATLIADYVENPPGSGIFRPESDYGDPDIDYFKSASNFINTNEFGSFLATFNAPYADANFIASFDLPEPDYDHDGKWDGLDFAAWKDEFGQTTAGLDADYLLDNDADGEDFLDWQLQFGQGVPGAAAIPEPAAITLTALAVLAALRHARRP